MVDEEKAQAAVHAFKKKGYHSHYVATKAEAKNLALSLIPTEASVGFGGSLTTRDLGLVEALRAKGNPVFDHWQKGLDREETLEIRRKQLVCDVFLTSANAVTVEGEIVNIDGVGNRVASTIFGPKKVIMVVGLNKITDNLAEAIERSKNVASVQNAKRLNRTTPCTKTGSCSDCSSPDRICNVTVILHRRPSEGGSFQDYHIIVVGEEIGF